MALVVVVLALAALASAQIVPQVPPSDAITLVLGGDGGGSMLVQRQVPMRLQDYAAFGPDAAAALVRYQNALAPLAPAGGADLVLVRASDLRRVGSVPLDGRSLALCEYAGGVDLRGRVAVLEYAGALNTSALSDVCARTDEFGDTQPLVVRSLLAAGALAVLTASGSTVGYYERLVTVNYLSFLLVRSYGIDGDARSLPFFKLRRSDFAALRARLLNATLAPPRFVSVGGATSAVSAEINERFGVALACQSALACLAQPVLGGVLFVVGAALLVLVARSGPSASRLQLALGAGSALSGACALADGAAACASFAAPALWASTVLGALSLALYVACVLAVARMWTTTIVATYAQDESRWRGRAADALLALLLAGVALLFALLVARSALPPLAAPLVALVLVGSASLFFLVAGALFALRLGRGELGARHRVVLGATTALLGAFSAVALAGVFLALASTLALTGELAASAAVGEQAVCPYALASLVLRHASLVLLQLFVAAIKIAQRRDATFGSTARSHASTDAATTRRASDAAAKPSASAGARSATPSSTSSSDVVDMETRASFLEAGLG